MVKEMGEERLAQCPRHGYRVWAARRRGAVTTLFCCGVKQEVVFGATAYEPCGFQRSFVVAPLQGWANGHHGVENGTKALLLSAVVLLERQGQDVYVLSLQRLTGMVRPRLVSALARYVRGGYLQKSQEKLPVIPDGKATRYKGTKYLYEWVRWAQASGLSQRLPGFWNGVGD